ncbi:MAG: hypothetical protein Q9175_000026 [Cornicularia normoerica]
MALLEPSKLVLYSRRHSVCSAYVRIAASLKQISLDIVECTSNLYKTPEYLKKNPDATVPTLDAHYGNGKTLVLTQSLSMLEFLEESYPGRINLIPPVTHMAARCRVRDLVLLVACDIQPLQRSRTLNFLTRIPNDPKILALSNRSPRPFNDEETQREIERIWIRTVMTKSLKVYEAKVKESAGKFSVGDGLSIADICLVVMVQRSGTLGMSFDESGRYPTIGRILKTCAGIDAFRLQGASKGLEGLHRSYTRPYMRGYKPNTNWPGLEPSSTKSQESNPDTRAFQPTEELLDRA